MLNYLHTSSISSRFLLFAWRCQPYWNSKLYLNRYHGFAQSAGSSICHFSNAAAPSDPAAENIPTDARVVIGGGGVIGCSVAYHLASAGWKNIVLLEQGRLNCGSSWQSSGVIGCLRSTPAEIEMVMESLKLYKQLQANGHDLGWRSVGSISLCRKQDRVIAYKRNLLLAQKFGVEGEFLSPTEIKTRVPLLRTEDLLGGMWVPGDCMVDAMKLTNALAKEARNMGVTIIEKCRINQVLTNANVVYGVETNLGRINCNVFVNCAGMWAHALGQRTNTPVRIPLHACEQSVIHSKQLPGISPEMPLIRDYDGHIYLHEYKGGLLGSGFPAIAKPAFKDGIPDNFEFQFLPEDWDYFKPLLDQLLNRVPSLTNVEVQQMVSCVDSSTPDGKYIMGEAAEIQNYYVAAGMCATGTAAAGGIGKYLAEWITNGESSINLWRFDIQRFGDLHNNKKFLLERVTETFGSISHVPYWEAELIGYDSGRRLRTSAVFTRNEPYAVFGQLMAYERPLYFHSSSMVDEDAENTWTMPKSASIHGVKAYELHETGLPKKGTYGKPEWLDNVKSEYWACREGVCVIDMSTFSKFELRSAGREVVDFLQYVCSNDVDRTVGSVVHTGIQNHHGGFESDCSVVRLAHNRYFLVGPTAQQTRSFAWLRRHLPKDGTVQLSDVTSMYTALDLIGPKAQELLSELTDTPLGKQDFMHMSCKEINVGMVSGIRAMRLTHTGEDGFMLYIPSEVALHVYDSLVTYGKNYGLRSAGYYALRALRTEKFFAYWGTDLTPQDTPLESGRDFRVKYDIGGFIGYSALLRQRAEGIRKRLVQFLIEDHNEDEDPWPWNNEPIYRNGVFCGLTTSSAYGFGLERHICLGFVHDYDPATGKERLLNPNEFILDKGARFEINIAGKMFLARALLYPPILPSPSTFSAPSARS